MGIEGVNVLKQSIVEEIGSKLFKVNVVSEDLEKRGKSAV